ncbi:acireductone dioxygenase family Adi1 [Schizosaccharomyces pombe]|uniref:Acireductone dioxygenase n=1 Tax=Schizosaccharomyces pombe (strain 972 / ATCC 24843) TaxID=284812 RepID=MTND_SCHPO|nr:putative acireductone dioxygenase family protein [Schizosaccharomyces pombe]O94286.1 RecName: Full=Acireductone dioxygenase; AltName: Full=Acireductone dioxygenase (Fe(2+)-requiring); Short=ARD'; Short=Fe-ARD; AltName: Full=Acireductone dioxygenase (Ni(2+)-requiring); Short=ARD; Short=Ni-ARD [Schizosaccharomyces pombe 972h-]CAA21886.1 acireductone dioxygenase family (predicted) [Schizosaccharomyces pombe]|eukprot:NP_596475.1 putative acireductone dioxygenase family protein [Schizosaccharomyces pombe]
MRAYIFQDEGDQRKPNDSKIEVSAEDLEAAKVSYRHHDGDLHTFADGLMKEYGFKNRDEVVVSRKGLGDRYDNMVKKFFEEHLHEDEEIRLILDGNGYFDVRSVDDRWVRIFVEKGDLIILPPGIYHRFTTTTDDYIHAMRLFHENPKWIALSRTDSTSEELDARKSYLNSIKKSVYV